MQKVPLINSVTKMADEKGRRTSRGHERAKHFDCRLSLTFLRFPQDLYTLLACLFRKAGDVFVRVFVLAVVRINRFDQNLHRLEGFLFRDRVRGLEDLELERAPKLPRRRTCLDRTVNGDAYGHRLEGVALSELSQGSGLERRQERY